MKAVECAEFSAACAAFHQHLAPLLVGGRPSGAASSTCVAYSCSWLTGATPRTLLDNIRN